MESKETYTPSEIAKMMETHLAAESNLCKVVSELTETRGAMYEAGQEERFLGYYAHTLKARFDTYICALRAAYEKEIPENVRKAFAKANLLINFEIDFLEPSETTCQTLTNKQS